MGMGWSSCFVCSTRRIRYTARVWSPHFRQTQKNRRTRRHIQRRVTSFFEFRLPFPPWMAYTFGKIKHCTLDASYGIDNLLSWSLSMIQAKAMPIERSTELILCEPSSSGRIRGGLSLPPVPPPSHEKQSLLFWTECIGQQYTRCAAKQSASYQ